MVLRRQSPDGKYRIHFISHDNLAVGCRKDYNPSTYEILYNDANYIELMQTKRAKICFFCNKKYQLPDAQNNDDKPQPEPIEDGDSSQSSSDDDTDTASEDEARSLPQA